MAGTHSFARRNQTEPRRKGRYQQKESTNEHQNTRIFSWRKTIASDIHTKPIRKDGQHKTVPKKGQNGNGRKGESQISST